MTSNRLFSAKLFLGVIAFISWAAIILQLYILVSNSRLDLLSALIHFFSFFTILSNLLIAVYSTLLLLRFRSSEGRLTSSTFIPFAITVYIIVVGMVYNIFLVQLWHPMGLQKVVDKALHIAVPILFPVYWVLFAPKGDLKWKYSFMILLFPFLYLIYTLLHGYISGFYPYPFLNVAESGYTQIFINSAGLGLLFWLVSMGLIGIGKMQERNHTNN